MQLEKPSSSQGEISGADPTYNRRHREEEGRREGGGWARRPCGAARCSGGFKSLWRSNEGRHIQKRG